jgi:hypothetical protein
LKLSNALSIVSCPAMPIEPSDSPNVAMEDLTKPAWKYAS